ncbi:hypothetical protein DAI22_03g188650 [Oryza sativa Japonica Group]|nr:hypothetical protein DAI22_03g188650 [Oryza sativa Japonica Group]
MDEGVKNHIPLDGTTGSRQILMDECNPSLDILDGESIPHGVQTSPVAMEEDVPLMVGSHDSGCGTSVTRYLFWHSCQLIIVVSSRLIHLVSMASQKLH